MPNKRGKEDYLRVILELDREKENIKSKDIAKKLKISKPSVSEMLRKLAREKLIEFSPYSKIKLTEKGESQAREIQNRHEIIEKFASKLQHPKPHEEAHNLEHHISPELIEKIRELTEGKRVIETNLPRYIS